MQTGCPTVSLSLLGPPVSGTGTQTVANRSSDCVPHRLSKLCVISGLIDKSMGIGIPLERLFAITFSLPGIWRA